jgi:hypothetical protein
MPELTQKNRGVCILAGELPKYDVQSVTSKYSRNGNSGSATSTSGLTSISRAIFVSGNLAQLVFGR